MPVPGSNPARRCALWLFLCFNFFYLLTSTGRVRAPDEVLVYFQTESLVLRQSLAVPQAVEIRRFYGKVGLDGQPRAPYPPAPALAATPWYFAGRHVLVRLPGVPDSAVDIVLGFATVASNATFSAAAVAFAFLLFVHLGASLRESVFASSLLGLATPLFGYSAWFFSEPLSSALLVGAALVLFGRPAGEPVPESSALRAGALLGLTVLVRFTHLLAAPLFFLALLVRDGRPALRGGLALMLGVALGAAALLTLNLTAFGHPLEFGYPETAEGGKRLNSFETPLSVGLYGFLLSPGKSVFIFAPPILLALLGLPRLWRRDPGLAALAALLPLAYLFLFARYNQWEGAYCVGPRYLVPALALLCLALGPALAGAGRWLRAAALALLLIGFVVQGIGLATSFMEDQTRRGVYFDEQYNYKLDYSPLRSQGELLLKYAVASETPPPGRGFDRWFLFLPRKGVAPATVATLAALMAAGLLVSAWRLGRCVARESA